MMQTAGIRRVEKWRVRDEPINAIETAKDEKALVTYAATWEGAEAIVEELEAVAVVERKMGLNGIIAGGDDWEIYVRVQ